MPVTVNRYVDDNDFEKVITLAQTAESVTANLRLDDGDVAAKINALQVAAGVPADQRTKLVDRKDWEKLLIVVQNKVNSG